MHLPNKSLEKTLKKFPQDFYNCIKILEMMKKTYIEKCNDEHKAIQQVLNATINVDNDNFFHIGREIFKDIYTQYNLSFNDVTYILIILITPNKIKSVPQEHYIKELEVAYEFSYCFDLYHEDCNINTFGDANHNYSSYNIERFMYVMYRLVCAENSINNSSYTNGQSNLKKYYEISNRLIEDNVTPLDGSYYDYNNKIRDIVSTNGKYKFLDTLTDLYINNGKIKYYLDEFISDNNVSYFSSPHLHSYVIRIYNYFTLSLFKKVFSCKDEKCEDLFKEYLAIAIETICDNNLKPLEKTLTFGLKNIYNMSDYGAKLVSYILKLQTEYILDNYPRYEVSIYHENFINYIIHLQFYILDVLNTYRVHDSEYRQSLEYFLENIPEDLFAKLLEEYNEVNNMVQHDKTTPKFRNRWNKLKLKYDTHINNE